MTTATLNRRAIMTAGLMASTVALMPRAPSAKSALPDFTAPEAALDAIMKMRSATDGRLCIGWLSGMRYAVVDGVATPLFGMLAATFSQSQKVAPDTYESRAFEIAYYTDLASGKLLDTWVNPLTSKTVTVPQTRSLMGKVALKATGLTPINAPLLANLDLAHQFRPAVVIHGEVSITEEIRIRNKAASTGPRFRYNENTTYTAKAQDLADAKRATVPTAMSYQSVIGFSPWLGMDALDGFNMGRGTGHRAEKVTDLPPYFLELTEKHHADVLHDPIAAIEGKLEKKPG